MTGVSQINDLIIRETSDHDLSAIATVHESAFGQNEEAVLTINLLADPSAAPCLSLMATVDGRPAGHILFTKVTITGAEETISASILAPLAVLPDHQDRGIGGALIREGLKRLVDDGTDLIFVLGHPGYYPRFGFRPAGAFGLNAPYPIPSQHADAWMALGLREGPLGTIQGRVTCADALDKAEYWKE